MFYKALLFLFKNEHCPNRSKRNGDRYTDYKTDAVLRAALKKEVADATVIIVAQRLSTVMHANAILVLEEGRMAGIGTHEELLQNCPAYRKIAQSQLSEKELGMKGGDNGEA